MNESCPPRETLQKSIKEGIAVGGAEMDGEVKLKERGKEEWIMTE